MFGCVTFARIVISLLYDTSAFGLIANLFSLAEGALFFYFGFKIVVNAALNAPSHPASRGPDRSQRS